jgi:hypothetical protein
MRAALIALVVVAASLAAATPGLALSEAMCSTVSQGTGHLSGPGGGVANNLVTQNCSSSPPSGGPTVVSTPEPLGAFIVGLGLLGISRLRRR